MPAAIRVSPIEVSMTSQFKRGMKYSKRFSPKKRKRIVHAEEKRLETITRRDGKDQSKEDTDERIPTDGN